MTDSERVQQWNGQKALGGNTRISRMQLGSIHTVMAFLVREGVMAYLWYNGPTSSCHEASLSEEHGGGVKAWVKSPTRFMIETRNQSSYR